MKHWMWLCLSLMCLALLNPVSAYTAAGKATYYVSPSGSNGNPGSLSQPWETLQHAADNVSAGDTVIVRAGTYLGFRAKSSGTSGLPITFMAYSGETAAVNAPGPDNWHDSNINIEGYDYWVIEDLEVCQSPDNAGIDVRLADHVTVQGCYCHHNQKWGIFTAFADYFTAENNTCTYQVEEHGIYVSNSGDYQTLRYNTCHHNAGAGIQLNADPSMGGDGIISYAYLEKNVLYANGSAGGAAINLASVRDSLIANNLIYANLAGGIAGWDDGQGNQWGTRDNRFFNNTVYQPAGGRWALNLIHGSINNEIKNNILLHAGSRGGIETDTSSLSGMDSNHNIMERASLDETWLTLAEWQLASGQDANSYAQSADDTFTNPDSDWHLKETAHAVDNGETLAAVTDDLDGTPRPQGTGYDMGCYEYASGGPQSTRLVLPNVSDTLAFRSNLGLTAAGASAVTVTVSFYDSQGVLQGAKPYSVPAKGYMGIINVIQDVTNSGSVTGLSGSLHLSWVSGDGPVFAIGGLVNNSTDDPAIQGCGGQVESGQAMLTPLVLKSLPWTTSLVLTNQTAETANASLSFYAAADGSLQATLDVQVPGNGQYRADDIVAAAGLANGFYGPMEISATRALSAAVVQRNTSGTGGIYPLFALPGY